MYPLCKLQPVKNRHFDVGYQNIRLQVNHGLLCLQTILGSSDNLTVELLPINQCAKALSHQDLVVRYQNSVHCGCPPLEAEW